MNKAQLIDALAPGFDGNRKVAAQALDTVLETITRTVVTGEKVGITGFGVFEKLDKPARTVRNPATGASVKKKKTSVPRFRPGAELKAYIAGEKKFARVPAAKKSAAAVAATRTVRAAKATATPAAATKSAATKATATKAVATKAIATKASTTRTAATKASAKSAAAAAPQAAAGGAATKATSTRAVKVKAGAPTKATRRAAKSG
jgi:DNA-binding protein HU-beta